MSIYKIEERRWNQMAQLEILATILGVDAGRMRSISMHLRKRGLLTRVGPGNINCLRQKDIMNLVIAEMIVGKSGYRTVDSHNAVLDVGKAEICAPASNDERADRKGFLDYCGIPACQYFGETFDRIFSRLCEGKPAPIISINLTFSSSDILPSIIFMNSNARVSSFNFSLRRKIDNQSNSLIKRTSILPFECLRKLTDIVGTWSVQ